MHAFPTPDRLMQPAGQFSPMVLLWTFMGYSAPYRIFTGLAELVGGLLLIFRRTTTLGALVVLAVMANVAMLNYCYDVPLKLFTTHLLLWSLFLLLPDLRRLANLLVLNRPVQPVVLRTPFQSSWLERSRPVLKLLLFGALLVAKTWQHVQYRIKLTDPAQVPALAGIYEVESFTRGGETLPPVLGETSRWRTVIVNRRRELVIRGMDDDPDHLVLEGPFRNEVLTVRLKRVDEPPFVLVTRGFHWMSDDAFIP
jgi:hypothetical protein